MASRVRQVAQTVARPQTRAAVLNVTDKAAQRLKEILSQKKDADGLRISVRTKGCSGNAFHLEYAKEKQKLDEEIIADGAKVWVDSKALLKVLGSTMDYEEDELREEFVFENPNVKGACGCGQSWFT
eukprot:m.113767 g.113767  ORF g.113767 m.113767 type:complete len:127 (+) comp14147_c2_seq1:225-605(+)